MSYDQMFVVYHQRQREASTGLKEQERGDDV